MARPRRRRTPRGSTRSWRRTWPAGATASSTRCTTSCSPTTPSGRRRCGAGTRGTASRWRCADGVRRPRRATATDGQRSPSRRASRRRPSGRCSSRCTACSTATASRAPTLRLLRAARVGDGLPARPRPGTTGRCGSGADGTDAVVESHRIACSHFDAFRFFTPDARPLQHPATPAATTGRRSSSPAACTPGWTSTSTRSGSTPMVELRPGRRLLRAGARHPRARHAGGAVRPHRPRLRPGPHRDAGGQAGVRRRAAPVRRARRAAAAAAHRGVRAAARGGGVVRTVA